MNTTFTVGEIARRTAVTVRTLHHYEQVGLLVPSERTALGHRRYGARRRAPAPHRDPDRAGSRSARSPRCWTRARRTRSPRCAIRIDVSRIKALPDVVQALYSGQNCNAVFGGGPRRDPSWAIDRCRSIDLCCVLAE
ncbi:MAG: MerR family DNA-binding transcriptional regulator [Candidatus Eremiobacteraeota bacterium]|nr:MerR family DNA-binding transcriptional regulator [Candidatus Eremiobacteraeota bacterium]